MLGSPEKEAKQSMGFSSLLAVPLTLFFTGQEQE
jgi:hypothetical protein